MQKNVPVRQTKILVIAEGQLGDLLILTPALRALRSSFPGALLAVMVAHRRHYAQAVAGNKEVLISNGSEGTAAVLRDSAYVDEVIEIDRGALRSLKGFARVKAEFKILRLLRNRKFDLAICTFPEDRFVIWALASGARVRVGQRRQRLSYLLTLAPDVTKEESNVLRYYCGLAAAAGASVDSYATAYRVPEAAQRWADGLLRARHLDLAAKLVAVHPGASGRYRVWPPERFAALIDHLQADGAAKVLLCGTDFDRETVAEVRRHLRAEVIEIHSAYSVAKFAAILKRCQCCISNDSGPRHLAVAVGTPALAFMPRFQDRQWKIYADERKSLVLQGEQSCPACPPGSCRDLLPAGELYGSFCLRMISVERALAAAGRLLTGNS